MCVATVIEKTTSNATSVLHQLILHYTPGLSYHLIRRNYGRLANEALTSIRIVSFKQKLNSLKITNCVNETTFQSGFRFQTGLSSLRVSCKRALSEKCSNTEFLLVRVFQYRSKYGEIRARKNSVSAHFSRSANKKV